MTVELQRGAVTIGGTDVSFVSDTEVTCDFDLTGASVGTWDVYLKHNDDDQSSTLPGAFFVHWPAISVSKTADPTSGAPSTDVTFTITVENTGDCTLNPVTVVDTLPAAMSYVSDDSGGSVSGQEITWDLGSMGSGASTTISLVAHIDTGAYGMLTDVVTATGTPPHGNDVSDTDTADVTALTPGISVVKTASLTGTCPGSDPLAVSIGDTVTYCFIVSNTGDVTLTSVTVNDDIYGPVTLGTTTLAPGETTEGTLTHVVVESDAPSVTNTATATGTDPLGGTVTDTDPCTINVALAPDIEVNKTASLTGTCPGSDPLAVSIGDTVTYCFFVSNTGDVTLTSVTVNDDIYGSVTLGTTTLAPGETTEGTITHIVVESDAPSVTNTATATGTDPLGGTVTDADDCTIDMTIAPGIKVVKTASLTGSCPGSDPLAVSIDDTVTYCFDVTNTGDVTLTSVTVNDDLYGPVTLGTTTLAPGETTEGTLTHIVTESDVPSVTNIATVNATDLDNNCVSDTDDCTINVEPSPCFIATAAYGTALHEDINVLREFRDEYLVSCQPYNVVSYIRYALHN